MTCKTMLYYVFIQIGALKKELCNPLEFVLLDNSEKMEVRLTTQKSVVIGQRYIQLMALIGFHSHQNLVTT